MLFVLGKPEDEDGYRSVAKGKPSEINDLMSTIETVIRPQKVNTSVLVTLLSLSLVGIMEGIPFFVSIGISWWNIKALSDKATATDLLSYVNMASVTTIITDKIGGLTEKEVEVVDFFVGELCVSESSMISHSVLHALCHGIETLVDEPHDPKNEAILSWAKEKLGLRLEENDANNLTHNGEYKCLHPNGSMNTILNVCSHYYTPQGEEKDIDDVWKLNFMKVQDMLNKELETVAFACKPTNAQATGLVLVGLLGLKTVSRKDTKGAIKKFKDVGVRTILVSGDDVSLLETIARVCGLLNDPYPNGDDLMLKGEEFRSFSDEERIEKIDRIRVMGNSLVSDKLLLLETLRKRGEVVAMLGQRTNDAPTLKQADIGITIGTWSSDKAMECSKITIWDGGIIFLVILIESGKCVHENIKKFTQLELITVITSSLISVIGAASLGDTPLTVAELFWVNLAVSFLGGLALLTEPSARKLMNTHPVKPTELLLTKAMIRNIATQALYQVTILVALQHRGKVMLAISEGECKSVIFNSFMLCQIFNLFTARNGQDANFFKGILENSWFWVVLVIFTVLQPLFIMFDEHILLGSASLNPKLWAGCFLIGIVSWLIDSSAKFASRFIYLGLARIFHSSVEHFAGLLNSSASTS